MTNIVQIGEWRQPGVLKDGGTGGLPPGGGGGDNEDMETRVKNLETAVTDVRERLARIESRVEQTATKDDVERVRTELHKSVGAQTWRLIGAAATLVAVVYFIAKNVA